MSTIRGLKQEQGENYLLTLFGPAQRAYIYVKLLLIAIGVMATKEGIREIHITGDQLHKMFPLFARELGLAGYPFTMNSEGKNYAVNFFLSNPEFATENGPQIFYPLLMAKYNKKMLEQQRDKEEILRQAKVLYQRFVVNK